MLKNIIRHVRITVEEIVLLMSSCYFLVFLVFITLFPDLLNNNQGIMIHFVVSAVLFVACLLFADWLKAKHSQVLGYLKLCGSLTVLALAVFVVFFETSPVAQSFLFHFYRVRDMASGFLAGIISFVLLIFVSWWLLVRLHRFYKSVVLFISSKLSWSKNRQDFLIVAPPLLFFIFLYIFSEFLINQFIEFFFIPNMGWLSVLFGISVMYVHLHFLKIYFTTGKFHTAIKEAKTIKFAPHLVTPVTMGKKTNTWRPFDDKDLQTGDILSLVNKNTGKEFERGVIQNVTIKKISDLSQEDLGSHNYDNLESVVYDLTQYYGDKVNLDTEIKMIEFKVLKGSEKYLAS
ncbi:MAG: hypothetical protein V4690_01795 [Patescibacteria group bacterium]